MRAVFIFLSFLLYGTNITILPTQQEHLQDIICLRADTKVGELKSLTREYIEANLSEFYIAKVNGIICWCSRIYELKQYHRVLELWSIRSKYTGVGETLVQHAESIAQLRNMELIAITNTKLEDILKERGWHDENQEYSWRKKESHDKNVWKISPQRLDKDSLQNYL